MRRKSSLKALAVVMALTAGCGGDDDEPDLAADREKAREAMLRAADFPSGWSPKPHEKLPGEDELTAEVAQCIGISNPSTRSTAEVRSPDFTSGFATTASSVITYVRSEEEAAADAAAFAGEKFAQCAEPGFAKQVQAVAPEGATVEDVKVSPARFPTHGDRTVAYRVNGTIHIGEMKVPVNIDLVRIFKGRAEVTFVFSNPGAPFPAEVARSVAAKVVERL
ncbi:MAG TPA: hypothetical protein VNA57_05310 [Acidimicrobiales bacterium]|nr:hypothetical protein [Acidimicrobiales bacterium]